jgi:hypothetical protein
MVVRVTTTVHNAGPTTIWGKLAERLGREPTDAEVKAEISRILTEGVMEAAMAGKLPHQRRRSSRAA